MAQPSIPARIGRYVIQSTIGRGAMGVIYRAHDPLIDRTVALKLVRADLLEGDERRGFVERFQREAQAAGRCAHANIVAIYDYALHEDNPYIAMEFIGGSSLAQVIQGSRRTPIDRAAWIVHQVLAALGCAHGHGVVHRDIKPANVLLAIDGHVKVTDFGISRLGGSSLTQTGALIGTPNYMSPEQRRGEAVDARSDLFSTGAVLYELLTGVLPFAGRSFYEVADPMLFAAPAPLSQHLPEAPPALSSFMSIALARDPSQRFESALRMSAALADAVRGIEPPRPVAAPAGGPSAAPPPAPAVSPVAEIERKLAYYVGPIARYLVRNAGNKTSSLDELCQSVAASIERADLRDAFLRDVRGLLGAGLATQVANAPTAAAKLPIIQADLDRAQADLTRYIGPIARVLVRRELDASANLDDLWQRLAAHIERPADRAAFLRGRPPR
ncbi:serine/threonine-protein kinase [Vineibacter terrae]|uniref:serine/threonine-protein kinase n=1 Tax=Vineibacter terrae TaxID=2586908 RepID=UPI002E342BFE|nr:serine/threonine-protein kinase [Vineibacter terrae]HEX2892306.1 serine/threonine-protein kinase [Vineibacter terrae]